MFQFIQSALHRAIAIVTTTLISVSTLFTPAPKIDQPIILPSNQKPAIAQPLKTPKTLNISKPPTSTKTIPSSPTPTAVNPAAPTVTPIVQPIPVPVPQPSPPKLINGKTLQQRVQEASDRLHTADSGQQIRSDFPDIQLVYSDNADNTGFPSMILPFKYYYSQEADKTFSICNINSTVFICTGKLDHLITKQDITSGKCVATSVYLNDPRLGGSGQYY